MGGWIFSITFTSIWFVFILMILTGGKPGKAIAEIKSLISDGKEANRRRRLAEQLTDADLISEERAIELVRQYVDAEGLWEGDEPLRVENARQRKPLAFRVVYGYPAIGELPSWFSVDRITGAVAAHGHQVPRPPPGLFKSEP